MRNSGSSDARTRSACAAAKPSTASMTTFFGSLMSFFIELSCCARDGTDFTGDETGFTWPAFNLAVAEPRTEGLRRRPGGPWSLRPSRRAWPRHALSRWTSRAHIELFRETFEDRRPGSAPGLQRGRTRRAPPPRSGARCRVPAPARRPAPDARRPRCDGDLRRQGRSCSSGRSRGPADRGRVR